MVVILPECVHVGLEGTAKQVVRTCGERSGAGPVGKGRGGEAEGGRGTGWGKGSGGAWRGGEGKRREGEGRAVRGGVGGLECYLSVCVLRGGAGGVGSGGV